MTFVASLTTYATSIPAHSWSFSGKAISFRTEFEFHPWSVVFSLHFAHCLHFITGLQFAGCVCDGGLDLTTIRRLWSFQWKRSVWKSSKQVRIKTVLVFPLRLPYHNLWSCKLKLIFLIVKKWYRPKYRGCNPLPNPASSKNCGIFKQIIDKLVQLFLRKFSPRRTSPIIHTFSDNAYGHSTT